MRCKCDNMLTEIDLRRKDPEGKHYDMCMDCWQAYVQYQTDMELAVLTAEVESVNILQKDLDNDWN